MENQKRTPFSGLASACSAVWDKTWPWMKLDGREQRLFCLLFSLHFLYLLPLILAGDYYRDDFARSLNGGFGWKELGRPFADLFMHFLSFGTPLFCKRAIAAARPLPWPHGYDAGAFAKFFLSV